MNTGHTVESIAVLGAGSSGQALAGFLALSGYRVRLWNRADDHEVRNWLEPILAHDNTIAMRGALRGPATVESATTDLAVAVIGADVILVNTTADAHRQIGYKLAAIVNDAQVIIVMSAGTLGAIDLWRGLAQGGFDGDILVGETSTTLFGSQISSGTVNISGRKQRIDIAGIPGDRTNELMALIPEIPFVAAADILETGLNNVGPCLHVAPMVLNAGWVEAQGGTYRYYHDGITRSVASVVQHVDDERIAIAKAFGKSPTSLSDYLVNSVNAPAGTLYESINGCEMYSSAYSPDRLNHRFLWEDTLAGAIPMVMLADLAGVASPTISALVTLASSLLGGNLGERGRTAASLGLTGRNVEDILRLVTDATEFNSWKLQMVVASESALVD